MQDGGETQASQGGADDAAPADQIAAGAITAEKIMTGAVIVESGRGSGYPREIRKPLAERIAHWWRWWLG
jgi:hypothetical protein